MGARQHKKKRHEERRIYNSTMFLWESIEPPKWRIFKYRKWLKLKPKAPKGCE